ncbi:HNH endonuclease [Natrialbaceae archaeon A-CW1-1]
MESDDKETDGIKGGSDQDTLISTGEEVAERPTRRGQRDFRLAVRERYDDACLLCDVSDPGLLQAGHILSWSDHEDPRGDPSNGLLLCYTHHRAFDLGLFTITSEYELRVQPDYDPESEFLRETVVSLDGTELSFPHDPPAVEYLRDYNEHEVHWYEMD